MKRVKWGIGAAAVVGLAYLLSGLFNGVGLGPGGGTQTSVQSPTTPDKPAPPAQPPLQSEPETEPVITVDPQSDVGIGGVVDVLIDERNLFLRRGPAENQQWIPATPETITAYAKQATGDETGIRVRIFRKPSARASVEEELIDSLGEIGVKRSEVDLPERLIE